MARYSVSALVGQLKQDAIDVVRAEIQLARARVMARVAPLKTGVILIVAAILIALLSLIGFVTGMVLALAALVGAAWAGVIVLIAGLAIAGGVGWFGASRLSAKPAPLAADRMLVESRP